MTECMIHITIDYKCFISLKLTYFGEKTCSCVFSEVRAYRQYKAQVRFPTTPVHEAVSTEVKHFCFEVYIMMLPIMHTAML
jgi:hypothetical protein